MRLPVGGHPLHTRSLSLVVTRVHESSWHARGDVIDLRKVGFVPMMDDIQPAGIIHQMSIDLRIDPTTRVIDKVDTEQSVVAIEPSRASRGECCRDPGPRLSAMTGERLEGDFAKRLSEVFGGALGCSHLLTLFQMMGPACVRAIEQEEALPEDLRERREDGERLFRRAVFVDGLEADDENIELALQQSDFHTRPSACVEAPFERLAGEWDVRVACSVGPGMTLSDLTAAERFRTHETLGTARWVDRSDRIAALGGGLIIPGLARRVFGLLGDEPRDGLLREAMLHLAPGHIQVMAAVMDRWFARGAADRPSDTESVPSQRSLPEVGSVGGMPDSCYMWRSGGALADRGFGRGPLSAKSRDDEANEPS